MPPNCLNFPKIQKQELIRKQENHITSLIILIYGPGISVNTEIIISLYKNLINSPCLISVKMKFYSTRITIIRSSKPEASDINNQLQWFGASLGLFGLRDKDKSMLEYLLCL